MNKTQLARTLSDRSAMTQAEALAVIETLFGSADGIIADALTRGEAIAIRGFGTFEVAHRAPRIARHPIHGGAIQVPAAKRPNFRPSAALKAKVNG
ncbi:MAG: DNA-binding protein HU-beta [Myxococcota bacterium]|jgi:DNA-binding protein HU-beta